MPLFTTGLILLPLEAQAALVSGGGWQTTLQRTPPAFGRGRRSLAIKAASAVTAQRALDLIWASLHIVYDGYLPLDDYPEVGTRGSRTSALPSHLARDTDVKASRWGLTTSGIAKACKVAAKASKRRRHASAAMLIAFSHGLACLHHMDSDPSYWRHGPSVSPLPRDYIRFAYAIIAAYAAIEQLGLELRASSSNPSRPGGVWNPSVRADLERRLRRSHVDVDDPALWQLRSTPRRPEKGRPTTPRRKADWAWGRIRDQEVELVDALADLSYLRSRISSHSITKATA
jgi:hypothetical protein